MSFLLLKTLFDSISRILLFATWLYVINDGQFSSTKTVIAYYSTFTLLFIFNAIFNKQKDYTSSRTWIGRYLFSFLAPTGAAGVKMSAKENSKIVLESLRLLERIFLESYFDRPKRGRSAEQYPVGTC